jgi:hypothetical protein
MKLFHASKHKFDVLKRQQVVGPDGVEVPASELQNKIYLTPYLGFAIAMAAGPDGMTSVVDGQISFEHYKQFDPERPVYVYEVDSDDIDPELIEQIDDEQVAVDLDELSPDVVHEYKAKNVFDYYKLIEWRHPNSK